MQFSLGKKYFFLTKTLCTLSSFQQQRKISSIENRRVVVTGLGLVTPLATGVEESWKKLINGEHGISSLANDPQFKQLPSQVAAIVKRGTNPGEFNSDFWIPKNFRNSISSFIEYGMAATEQALQDSNWKPESEEEKQNTGVAIGSGIGSIQEITSVYSAYLEKGSRAVSPFFVPKILINLVSGNVSIRYGFQGPNHAVSTACSTGANAIGDAFRFIKFGDADVMVAGGTEACIYPLCLAGFSRAKALATKFNDTPGEASRPFDKNRDGFVIGEGSGVIVLEEYEHAKKRGAKIYAEILGYGCTGDAYHITAPHPDGIGPFRAMQKAILQSKLALTDIGYINAHATSTPLGDANENTAIKKLFGKHAYELAVSSTKGAVGHLLGASGSVEAIFTILSLQRGILPPTINLKNLEPEFDLNYVPLKSQEKQIHAAMTNSFGFGGVNVSLVFAKI